MTTVQATNSSVEQRFYQHGDFRLCYLFKDGFASFPPLFLVHPVGIGCASWVWKRLMPLWPGKVYAPDLIGCGIAHGSDPWDPKKAILSFPDSWVQSCESLLRNIVTPKPNNNPLAALWTPPNKPCIVVAQGGLAPVGVLLAARNQQTVQQLVLTSPPTYKDLVKPVPQKELDRNYNFLSSGLGERAFDLLESRFNIEFFSNQFLFAKPCDEEWLQECEREACKAARPPIQAFNAGLCMSRSFKDELENLSQPLLILQGDQEIQSRREGRLPYLDKVPDCEVQTIEGKNLLIWETPNVVANAILSLLNP